MGNNLHKINMHRYIILEIINIKRVNNKIKIRVAFDEEEKFSGLYKEYYQDGSLKEECIYIKGNLIKKYK